MFKYAMFAGILTGLFWTLTSRQFDPWYIGVLSPFGVCVSTIIPTIVVAQLLKITGQQELPYGSLPIPSWIVIAFFASVLYAFTRIIMNWSGYSEQLFWNFAQPVFWSALAGNAILWLCQSYSKR